MRESGGDGGGGEWGRVEMRSEGRRWWDESDLALALPFSSFTSIWWRVSS